MTMRAGVFGWVAFVSASLLPVAKGDLQVQNFMSFPANAYPTSALVFGRDGNFYITTNSDGKYKGGTIAQISPAGRYKIVHDFENGDVNVGGTLPRGVIVVGDDGSIYGSTDRGGAFGNGVIYRFSPDGTFTVLHTITGEEGTNPQFLALASDGNLYCTLESEGSLGTNGAVIKVTPAGVMSVVKVFEKDTVEHQPDAAYYAPLGTPRTLHIGPDGALYVGCATGGYTTWYWYQGHTISQSGWRTNQNGGIARIDIETGDVTEFTEEFLNYYHPFVYNFDVEGKIYGLLEDNRVIRFSPVGESDLEVDLLENAPRSYHMIKGSDGNIYGESVDIGGTFDEGFIYKMTPAGVVTTIHNYPAGVSQDDRSGIAEGNDGFLYEIVVPNLSSQSVALGASKKDSEISASAAKANRARIGVIRMKLFDLATKRNLPPMAKRDIVPLSALIKGTGTTGSYSAAINVLANDRDVEKGTLNLVSVSPASNGEVQIDAQTKRVVYRTQTPGPDSFTYTIADANGAQSVGTVKIAPDLSGVFSGSLVSPEGTKSGSLELTISNKKAQKISGRFTLDGATYSFTTKLNEEGRIIVIVEKGKKGGWPVSVELVPSLGGTEVQFVGTVFKEGIQYQTTLSH